jgi:hypothetical protein
MQLYLSLSNHKPALGFERLVVLYLNSVRYFFLNIEPGVLAFDSVLTALKLVLVYATDCLFAEQYTNMAQRNIT